MLTTTTTISGHITHSTNHSAKQPLTTTTILATSTATTTASITHNFKAMVSTTMLAIQNGPGNITLINNSNKTDGTSSHMSKVKCGNITGNNTYPTAGTKSLNTCNNNSQWNPGGGDLGAGKTVATA